MKIFKISLFVVVLSLLLAIAGLIIVDVMQEESTDATVDYNQVGIVQMEYGSNENGNWEDFANSVVAQGYQKDVGSKYIRVWISSQWYRPSTIPLKSDGRWDYTNTDRFINAVLATGATPFVVFAHAPGTYGEAHGNPPPKSDVEFAHYVKTVVSHLEEHCDNGQYVTECNINNWYFEVWNEPYNDEWWEDSVPRYSKLYNMVSQEIKTIAPDAKVGGFGIWFLPGEKTENLEAFLENSEPDFVDLHHYGNIIFKYAGENRKMNDIKTIMYDNILTLRKYLDKRQDNVEIIMGEYNSDYRAQAMPELDEQFTAAWTASALIWQIKSQEVDIELFYSGTSLHEDKGFAMWSRSLETWPVYDMKKPFTQINSKGSIILDIRTNDKTLDALAVENNEGRFLTLVNKEKNKQVAYIHTKGADLMDVQNKKRYMFSDDSVSIELSPYEVGFYEII